MASPFSLPYGRAPYLLQVPAWLESGLAVVEAPTPPPALTPERAIDEAMARPIGRPLVASPGDRIVIIVSDHTRSEPRTAMVEAVLARLPENVRPTLAIATGTHGPADMERLALPDSILARCELLNHDGHHDADLVEVGRSRRGTPFQVHRCVAQADLVVCTGQIKPHYFAGFGAGAKAIFPGLGGNRAIRINHQLKAEPGARAGVVDGNPCREDLEEILDCLPGRAFLINTIVDPDDGCQAAVAGDVRAAFRAGAEQCRALYTARGPRRQLVVASDRRPVTDSLYQASKMLAAVAPLVAPGGTVVLVADCRDGVGPVETVNEAIYELGIRPRLPADHRVVLVSDLPAEQVARSYCEPAARVEDVLDEVGVAPVLVPRASTLLIEAEVEA